MPVKIKTMAEAKQRAAELAEFLDRFSRTLGDLTGTISGYSRLNAPSENSRGAPAKMQDRIITILSDAGKPLSPKEIFQIYQSRGWPGPDGKNPFRSLSSCIYYLGKTHKIKHEGRKYGSFTEKPKSMEFQ